ncbi:hypothetical protein A6E01_19060 (plasmid) [Vibrio breoganii]|uniref:Flagellar hook-associated protein 2 n=2 Tax=Vibrio TaxID=662 RepID=A0AAN1CUI9_9VIBR|nr:flagellar filament capping protein FliD [Vibrio breoganii]ANO35314.1 hypothetical protein A6E01_19060 [Vibrio breoganii]PML12764.1 hypothetical protein BCT84_02445 [Vibrio breoganii]
MNQIDAQGMAAQFAMYDIAGIEARNAYKLDVNTALQAALRDMRSGMNSLTDSLYKFTRPGTDFIQRSVSLGSEDYFSVTTSSDVTNVDIDLFVEQLAARHQTGFPTAVGDVNDEFATADGVISVEINGETVDIDLAAIDSDGDGSVSMAEFASAFNAELDGKATVSLVQSGGEIRMIFASDEEGAENSFTITGDGNTGIEAELAAMNASPITEGRDAVVWLGEQGSGLRLTNSSNTFENLVSGVNVSITRANEAGDPTTKLRVSADYQETRSALNEFISQFNTFMSAMDSITATGGDTEERGLLANDSTVRGIARNLESLMRGTFEGVSLYQVGIEIGRDGKVSVDADRFDDALLNMDVETILNGPDGLFKSLEDTIKGYSNSSTGDIQRKLDTLSQEEKRLNTEFDGIQRKYDMYYSRYLAQFNRVNTVAMEMANIASMFY